MPGIGKGLTSGRWKKRWFCVACYRQLSYLERVDSHGCCPFCGNLSEGTVVDTVERSVEAGRTRVAWTIYKLKVVRFLLRPLMKLHIWYISREKDIDRLDDPNDPECICGLITSNPAACKCGCGLCCPQAPVLDPLKEATRQTLEELGPLSTSKKEKDKR